MTTEVSLDAKDETSKNIPNVKMSLPRVDSAISINQNLKRIRERLHRIYSSKCTSKSTVELAVIRQSNNYEN